MVFQFCFESRVPSEIELAAPELEHKLAEKKRGDLIFNKFWEGLQVQRFFACKTTTAELYSVLAKTDHYRVLYSTVKLFN